MLPGLALLAEQARALGLANGYAGNPMPQSPWCYNALTGKFERLTAGGSTGAVGGYPSFIYCPGKKQYYLIGQAFRSEAGAVAVFDPAKREWSPVAAKGAEMGTGYDLGGCLDTKRNRIYVNGFKGFMAFDIEAATWIKLDPKGTGPEVINDSSTTQRWAYDAARDAVVAIQLYSHGNRHPELVGVHAYDPAANAWTGPAALPANLPKASANSMCFDPELNAFFCLFASDGGDDGVMWAYRYKKAAEKK